MTSRVAALIVALVVLVACTDAEDSPVTDTPRGPDSPKTESAAQEPHGGEEAETTRQMEQAIFEMVDAERAERGLPLLEWDEQLAGTARAWTSQMADRGVLEHQDPRDLLRSVEGFNGVGENIFQSTGPIPAGTIHVGWMRSDTHRSNVLEPGWERLGVGVVCRDGETWATQHFGSTGGQRPDPGASPPPRDPIVGTGDDGPACPDGPGGSPAGGPPAGGG
jgi:uncharacterized protein YkwD